MQPVLTSAEARSLDETAPVDELMERAGWAVAQKAAALGIGYGDRVVVLAGPGNNGGDGYVAARHLRRRGAKVKVLALAPPQTPPATRAAAHWDGPVEPLHKPLPAELVVDAVFGGGFHRGLPSELEAWLHVPLPVLAVDLPSGLEPDTGDAPEGCFRAIATIAFHALRPGHVVGLGPDVCGEVAVADIGLEGGQPELLLAEEVDAPRPVRPRSVHKWTAGSLLVVGGEAGMTGAPILAARSALNFGTGAVGIASPQPVSDFQFLTYSLDDPLPERYLVLALGPGLGAKHGGLVSELLANWPGPLVLDADGINTTTVEDLTKRIAPTVITPHAGEFTRFTGQPATHHQAKQLAATTNTVVLLKGNPTFATDGNQVWLINTGGPELATIGTGDVLTGLIGALLARGLDPLAAARSGAYWLGIAGADLAKTGTVTARSLADNVGRFAAP